MKGISVVVPTHFRADLLKKTLNALLAQNYSKKKFEIIVVGYKKDKPLNKVIEEFSDQGISFFKIKSKHPDKKRNFGIRKAKNKIVAFTDDDCVPSQNWLKSISESFEENPGIGGVEGLTWNDNQQLYYHAPKNLSGERYLACNYAFKKEVLREVNGFDENYHLNYREDTDLAFKILKKGHRIIFNKKARVYHPPVKKPLITPLKELKFVRNDVLLYKKFPELYKEHFGFICRGSIKQAVVSWLAFFSLALSVSLNWISLILTTLIAVVLFKYFVEMKNKKFNPFQGLAFTLFSFLHDLLFPFYFLSYWITVKGEQ